MIRIPQHIWQRVVVCGLAVLLSTGCQSLGPARSTTHSGARSRWWNENKHLAVFEAGKGFSVPGVEGYFDELGRPMDASSRHRVPGEPAEGVVLATAESETDPRATETRIEEEEPTIVDWVRDLGKPKRPDPGTPEARQRLAEARGILAEAEVLFQQQEYGPARAKYQEARQLWPDSTLAEDALLMMGECHFFLDKYPEANDHYNELAKKYPNSRHMDTLISRQFSIARYWEQHHRTDPHLPITPNINDKTRTTFDTKGHALRTYTNIRLNDPAGPRAADAVMATAGIYFLDGKFDDADYYYELLRKEYPDSEHLFEAYLLGLQCKIRKYQGPDYDGTPLIEAERLIEQLLTQFPDRIGKERERVQEVRNQVAANLAQRDLRMAEFYENKGEIGTARFYYGELVREYPQTEIGRQAETRLQELRGEPGVPTQRFQWLVDLLPNDDSLPAIATDPNRTTTTR